MEKTGSAQELSSISSFFISGPEEKKVPSNHFSELKGISFVHPGEDCEVEETITVRKRIAYSNTTLAQENIKKTLFNFLEEGYAISRIELRKTCEKKESGNRTVTNEEIALYMK